MKTILWILAAIVVVVAVYYHVSGSIYNVQQGDLPETMTKDDIEVTPREHASFIIRWGETIIYNDPVDATLFADKPAPHIILITDIHGDHLSVETLQTLGGDAPIIAPQAVIDLLPESLKSRALVLANGESLDVADIHIEAMPAYNLPDAENADRHVKGRGNGYLLEKQDVRVYIAGDTAGIPEMRALTDIYMAFIPMNLPYTMGVEEAADAVLAFKPKIVYPYHYRGPDGLADIVKFSELVVAEKAGIQVMNMATWYPDLE